MAGLPDPADSRAVLIGVTDFEGLPSLTAVAANVEDLAKALAGPRLWTLPAENISIPRDIATPYAVRKAVREAAAKAKDTLLVYYGGHGLLDDVGKLHLAIASSNEEAASGVPYTWIHDEVSAAKAPRKIVILDCCYAERALHQSAAMELGPDNVQIPNTSGMYLFFAATKNEKARVGNGRHTIFTGELLRLLEEGIVHGPRILSLRDIYDNMLATFPDRNFPEPRLYGDLRSDGVVFGENPAWTPDTPPTPSAISDRPDGVITAESLERDLLAEQRAAIRARPSIRQRARRGGGVAEEQPQLLIRVLGGDEIRGVFQVRVTGRGGMSVEVELTRDVLDQAMAMPAEDDAAEAESLLQQRRTQTPMLEVLAWALLNSVLPPAGPSRWSPHKIGNGYAPDADVLREPGRRTGERPVVPTDAERDVRELIEAERHVLLLGAGASGKTTIARSQARASGDATGDGVVW
ncbi:MAG: caspase, EACC1-associated type, partial [Catenulispora sp.]